MFEVGMSALVLKICSEYAKSLGLNFPPCTQQEINAICEWVDKHTIKDMTISQNGYNVTFTFKTENDVTKEFTFTIPKKVDIDELEKVLKGSDSVVVDRLGDNSGLQVRLAQSVLNDINSKLAKPANPTADSAVTMLADGTVGTKPLSEIGGGGDLNLENGTGLDTLVLKYSGVVDDTHFASSTTGESDVCLGEANTSSGKRNILGGKLNENAGSNNLIAGLRNNVSSNHNVVGGQNNTDSQGISNLIGGQNNTNSQGASNLIGGQNNTNNQGTSNLIGGQQNTVSSSKNIAAGYVNTVKGSNNIVAGHENTVSENGRSNIVAREQNLLGRVVNSIICGDNEDIQIEKLANGIKAGHALLNSSDIYGKALLGHYNSPKMNTLVEVGNGNGADDRKNAFEVLKDGRAKVQSAPIESDDVVRKADLANIGGGKLYMHKIGLRANSSQVIDFYFYSSTDTHIPLNEMKNYFNKIQALYMDETMKYYTGYAFFSDTTISFKGTIIAAGSETASWKLANLSSIPFTQLEVSYSVTEL